MFFLLKSGSVRLYRLTPSGKRLDLAVIEPGMFFGEMSLLGESRRDTFAEVVEESLIFVPTFSPLAWGAIRRRILLPPTLLRSRIR